MVLKAIKIFSFFIHIQPLFIKKILAASIGLLWFDVLRIRRTTAIENVLRAYPHISWADARDLARKSLIHMGHTLVEFSSMPFLHKASIESMFQFEGMEKLHKALKEERGVLMLSAHIGNGDLATAALSQKGFEVYLVSKMFKSKWLNNFWFTSRERYGTQFIPSRKSSYQILKALRKNAIVIFPMDQYTGPPNGVPVDFFNIKTGTAFGPALFAQRSKTRVLPTFSYRKKPGQYVIRVLDPIQYETEGTKEELILKNTQLFNDSIERMIKERPEQWMWIHRRWKQGW